MPPLKMTWEATKALFARPVTRVYPIEKRQSFAATRGRIAIVAEKCILCVLCDKKCPTGAIKVLRNEKTWSIDRLKCIQCNYCVEVCPKKCLAMENPYSPPVTSKEIFTVAIPFTPPAPKPPAAPAAPPPPAGEAKPGV